MDENRKVILTGILIIALIALAVAVYYLFLRVQPREPAEIPDIMKKPRPGEEITLEEEVIEPIQVELDESDGVVRQLAGQLSSHPKLGFWLATDELIRKFVASVDNLASGQSPRPHIDFFAPVGKFSVIKKGGLTVVDPAGYARYSQVADVFSSLDTEKCVRLYKQLKLSLQEAYQELGYPQGDFHDALKRAIVEVLRVPIVEDDILLEKEVVTYRMKDPELESLSEAQKHLLRMGPENLRKIQLKLREMVRALGI